MIYIPSNPALIVFNTQASKFIKTNMATSLSANKDFSRIPNLTTGHTTNADNPL